MTNGITAVAKTAKTYGNGVNLRKYISHSFKDEAGAKITVTRCLNSDNNVLYTRMKKISSKLLKNDKKIITREDELHLQKRIPGTDIYQQGARFIDKLVKINDRVLSKNPLVMSKGKLRQKENKSSDFKYIAGRTISYYKDAYKDFYSNISKKVEIPNVLSVETEMRDTANITNMIRKNRQYAGPESLKLQYSDVVFDTKGLPIQENKFKLEDFSIFN